MAASAEAKTAASGLVNDFRPGGISKWPTINRGAFADGLIVRINDPKQISSSASQLCGAASVIYNLADADPSRRVKIFVRGFPSTQATFPQ